MRLSLGTPLRGRVIRGQGVDRVIVVGRRHGHLSVRPQCLRLVRDPRLVLRDDGGLGPGHRVPSLHRGVVVDVSLGAVAIHRLLLRLVQRVGGAGPGPVILRLR